MCLLLQLLCALNYWHLTCGFGSYNLLPPISKEWGRISVFKCNSIWTILHQFHPLRNSKLACTQPNSAAEALHCNCHTFAKALVLIHTGAKSWSQQAGEIVQVCSWQKHNWTSAAGVQVLCSHTSHCTCTAVPALVSRPPHCLGWRNSISREHWHLELLFVCAQQKHLHTWAHNYTWEHITTPLLHAILKSCTVHASC